MAILGQDDCNVIISGNNPATTSITETFYPRTDFSSCTIDADDVHVLTFLKQTTIIKAGYP